MTGNEGSTKVPPEWLVIFSLGGCSSMMLLWTAMEMYGDQIVWQGTVWGTVVYWFIAVALSSAYVVLIRRRS